jgi:hypothetical protein
MPLSTVLGAQSLVQPAVCTTATRPASPYTGQAIYDTTLSQVLVYNGTAWAGVGALVPVVSATTVTAATTITGTPFSATYDNYLILMTMSTSTASAINFQLSASGTPATTNYNRQHIEASGATVSSARSTGESSYFWSNAATTANAYSLQIINPFKVSRTELIGQGNYGSATTLGILNIVANNSNATSYDGFKIFFDSTYTGTGTYTVYGYGK